MGASARQGLRGAWLGAGVCAAALGIAGCAARPDETLVALMANGAYGRATERVEERMPDSRRGGREYLLDRVRLLAAGLADGQAAACELTANEVFEILRTQGINADKTVSSVVLNEDLKFWKGEPFEQALSFHYVSLQKAMRGEWGNARAAAQGSLFLLKDFGLNARGERLSSREIAERTARAEDGDEYLDHGYTPVKTTFALGYLMNAIANHAMGRHEEASDNLVEAERLVPALSGVAARIGTGDFNTILVVDYGLGPQKSAYGPDDSLVRFVPRTPSDQRSLAIRVNGWEEDVVPWACDVNEMARDHMWNNLEDVRAAKSLVGRGLLVGGTILVAQDDQTAQLVGLGLLAGGLFSMLGAHADTRFCEVMPQRVYVAPIWVEEPDSVVELTVAGQTEPVMVLPGVGPPRSEVEIQVVYARPPAPRAIAPWARSDTVVYANDAYDGPVAGDDLPYILGGRCVRLPTQRTLDAYQRAGRLLDVTLPELLGLYRAEGITLSVEDQGGMPALHVLEGGRSLVTPEAGSAGYARLFCQEHPAYRPTSGELRRAVESVRAGEPAP